MDPTSTSHPPPGSCLTHLPVDSENHNGDSAPRPPGGRHPSQPGTCGHTDTLIQGLAFLARPSGGQPVPHHLMRSWVQTAGGRPGPGPRHSAPRGHTPRPQALRGPLDQCPQFTTRDQPLPTSAPHSSRCLGPQGELMGQGIQLIPPPAPSTVMPLNAAPQIPHILGERPSFSGPRNRSLRGHQPL